MSIMFKKKIVIINCRCDKHYCSKCISEHDCSFNFKSEFRKNKESHIIDMKQMNKKIDKI